MDAVRVNAGLHVKRKQCLTSLQLYEAVAGLPCPLSVSTSSALLVIEPAMKESLWMDSLAVLLLTDMGCVGRYGCKHIKQPRTNLCSWLGGPWQAHAKAGLSRVL
jgi:hypothetical protein